MYSQANTKDIEAIIKEHSVLVKRIAHHLLGRLPDHIQVDDLIQSGMVGLLEAAQKYEDTKGASFSTYAGIRIRGAMLDDIRRGDWAPRSVHRNGRKVSDAIKQVENHKGSDAQDSEIIEYLGISAEEYHQILSDTNSCRLFSFEELLEQQNGEPDLLTEGDAPNPLASVERSAFQQVLAQSIKTLPEREQLVLSLYYDEELNLKEIGEVLKVSESRVSQLHSQAALRLRKKLQDWISEQR